MKVMRSKNVSMGLSIEWIMEFIDAFIDGDAKEESEDDDCTGMTWGVLFRYCYGSFQLDLCNLTC